MSLNTLPPSAERQFENLTDTTPEEKVADTIRGSRNESIASAIVALEGNQALKEQDQEVHSRAVNTLKSASEGHANATVAALDNGVLGQNIVGTNNEQVNQEMLVDAAITGNDNIAGITFDHEYIHSLHDPNARDLVGKDGEAVTVFHQREGDAQESSDASGVIQAPDNYKEARERFKANGPNHIRTYTRGEKSFEAAQTAIFRESTLNRAEQERALERANVQAQVAQRILRGVHGTRTQFERGQQSTKPDLQLAA